MMVTIMKMTVYRGRKSNMTAEQTRDMILSLSRSQGFYGRLYRDITEDRTTEEVDEIFEELGKDCKDVLDLVFKLEV